MSKRRKAREMALQMLYQSDVGGATWPQVRGHFSVAEYSLVDPDPVDPAAVVERSLAETPALEEGEVVVESADDAGGRRPLTGKRLEEAVDYARRLAAGTLERCDELDRLIRERAENWRLERMPAVDRNILRLAVYELLYQRDVPPLVVVDEAIELAKRFGSEKSGQFINGVLDGLLKRGVLEAGSEAAR